MIRFIHTSDWHLGQNFMNRSREQEHRLFLDWLLETIKNQQIDALVIAGDIFDTGTPPSYARRLYFDFLKELNRQCPVQVVIIGGNHDSVSTLNESGTLLELLDIHVIGGKKDPVDETFFLKNQAGENKAVISAIPFLRDRDVRLSVEGENFDSKKDALRQGIRQHYQQALTAAKIMTANEKKPLPLIATGHLTTTGGEVSEGVRDIYIGSLENYDLQDFPDEYDYIALGHLHKKQIFGKRQHIRYSGSPIPMSFGEASTTKIINIVELELEQAPKVTEVDIPNFRQLLSFEGSLEHIQQQISKIEIHSELSTWAEVTLEADTQTSAAQALINDAIKDLPLEILRFKRKRHKQQYARSVKAAELTLKEMTVKEVFSKRLSTTELSEEAQKQVNTAFNEIYTDFLTGDDS